MRFNIFKRNEKRTLQNFEGAPAFQLSPETELYTAVATASLGNHFYESADTRIGRIRVLIKKNEPEFVAKLAVYTRTEMHMRSVPLVLLVELAKASSGNTMLSTAVEKVVRRADEIMELLAYYQLSNERVERKKLNKLSKQIQKGLAKSFNHFDEYQFAKYNREAEVSLRDALFLVHPKAKDEHQQLLFNKIANEELAVPYTWETRFSELGKQKFENDNEKQAAKRKEWEALIDSKQVGYMAMMRNLRNIILAEVSVEHMIKVCAFLSNEENVANAKQLPFRFLAAYREIKILNSDVVSMVLDALEKALSYSVKNVKGFDEYSRIVIACDVSGSMQKPISARSKILLFDISLLLGMLLQSKSKRVVTGMFGDTWKIINMPGKNILSNVDEYYKREGEVGYATNGHKVIDDLIKRKVCVDKVMMFTDCQMWDHPNTGESIQASWNKYKKMSPNAKLYLFDLAGYGNSPIDMKGQDVFLIAGWSDKVFEVLNAIEAGDSAIDKIKQVVL